MKYVKMLGLAAIAAAALMAFVGASSASATVLCKTTPTGANATCPEGWAYPGGTTIHAVNVGPVRLDSSFKTIECGSSTIHGTTSNEGDGISTVEGPISALTFTECNCTVTVLQKGTLEAHWIPGTHNATLTSNGAEVTVVCSTIFGNVHCIYVTENDSLGDLTASTATEPDAVFHSEATIKRKTTNVLCDEQSTWTATYRVTEPTPLYVGKET